MLLVSKDEAGLSCSVDHVTRKTRVLVLGTQPRTLYHGWHMVSGLQAAVWQGWGGDAISHLGPRAQDSM